MKKWILITIFVLTLTINTTLADNNTSYIDIALVADGDIIANLTGIVNNGTMTIYINGIEIQGELSKLWTNIEKVSKTAKSAYSKASKNYKYIISLQKDVQDNTERIYIIRNEIVAFEEDYFKVKEDYYVFKNETNSQIQLLQVYIDHLRGRIEGEHQFALKYINLAKQIAIILAIVLLLLIISVVYIYKVTRCNTDLVCPVCNDRTLTKTKTGYRCPTCHTLYIEKIK